MYSACSRLLCAGLIKIAGNKQDNVEEDVPQSLYMIYKYKISDIKYVSDKFLVFGTSFLAPLFLPYFSHFYRKSLEIGLPFYRNSESCNFQLLRTTKLSRDTKDFITLRIIAAATIIISRYRRIFPSTIRVPLQHTD